MIPHDGYPMLSERVESKMMEYRRECANVLDLLNSAKKKCATRDDARFMRDLINYYNSMLRAYNLMLGDSGGKSFKAEALYRSVNWPDGLTRELRLVCGLVDLEIYKECIK